MSINEINEKIKPFYPIVVICLVAIIFFILGRLSIKNTEKTAINITYPEIKQTASVINASSTIQNEQKIQQDGPVIGSKGGKKYYFPWCGTVKRIKPENQVKFNSIEEAKNSGFTPGGNCKGLW